VSLGGQPMPYKKLTQTQSRIIIGMKETLKAMKKGDVSEVFIADDADHQITDRVIALAEELEIPYRRVASMKDLGTACGIDVGTSTAAIKQQ